jgi:hypothetical protein
MEFSRKVIPLVTSTPHFFNPVASTVPKRQTFVQTSEVDAKLATVNAGP